MTGRDRIFESPVDKQEVKCNVKSRPDYFPVNVYALLIANMLKK